MVHVVHGYRSIKYKQSINNRISTQIIFHIKYVTQLAEWRSGSLSALPCERPGFVPRTRLREIIQANNSTMQGQELGLPGCDEALSGMGGASLTNEVLGVM